MSTNEVEISQKAGPYMMQQVSENITAAMMMFDPFMSAQVVEMAKNMAKATITVPEHLRGNTGDCLAIVMQAAMWRLNPYAVAQKTYVVHGTLGYESQLVNAVLTSLRVIRGRFRYEEIGDWSKIAKRPKISRSAKGYDVPSPGWAEADEEGIGIRVTATLSDDDEPRQHTLWMVQAYPRNSTLWAVNPQQQLGYLAVKQWARKYAPDAILGVYTADEIQSERVIQGSVVSDRPLSLYELKLNEDATRTPDSAWPKVTDDGVEIDSRSVPYDARFHSSGARRVNDDGTWRMRRGHDPSLYAKFLDEHRRTRAIEQGSGLVDEGKDAPPQSVGDDELGASGTSVPARTTYPECRAMITAAKTREDLAEAGRFAEAFDGPEDQHEELVALLTARLFALSSSN